MGMKCPDCEHENRPGVIICENCNTDLYTSLLEQVSTKQLDKSRERMLRIDRTMPSSNPIVIYIRHATEPIAVQRVGKLTVGRADISDETTPPDIDLSVNNADELGVSRLHMELDAEANPPIATDLNSYNGTFLNGQKLAPNQPYPIQSSDEIRLGRLVLRIFYDAG